MKKIFRSGLLIAVLIVLIAFIPDAGNRLLSWLIPPRVYILLSVIAIFVLYKILIELRNRNNREDVPAPDDSFSSPPLNTENNFYTYHTSEEPDASPNPAPTKIWSEEVSAFLARNENAKQVKLAGKPDEFAYCDVGCRCHVDVDEEDNEKYNVFCGDDLIGRLPASAISYAEKADCPPDDLSVIVSGIDYDYDRDRYVISVYISD